MSASSTSGACVKEYFARMTERQGSGDREHVDDVEELLRQRRSENPRHSPGREPLGTATTRRVALMTAIVLAVATALLAGLFLIGPGA